MGSWNRDRLAYNIIVIRGPLSTWYFDRVLSSCGISCVRFNTKTILKVWGSPVASYKWDLSFFGFSALFLTYFEVPFSSVICESALLFLFLAIHCCYHNKPNVLNVCLLVYFLLRQDYLSHSFPTHKDIWIMEALEEC